MGPLERGRVTVCTNIGRHLVFHLHRRQHSPPTSSLPCVRVGTQKSAVPMELCIVVPQGPIPAKALTPKQSADQIQVCAMRPDVRKRRVDEIREEVGYDEDPVLKGWVFTVDRTPLHTQGHVIVPPKVGCSPNSKKPRVQFGTWNLVDVCFFQPGNKLVTWGVLDYTKTLVKVVEVFIKAQVDSLQKLGVHITTPKPETMKCDNDPNMVRQHLQDCCCAVFW